MALRVAIPSQEEDPIKAKIKELAAKEAGFLDQLKGQTRDYFQTPVEAPKKQTSLADVLSAFTESGKIQGPQMPGAAPMGNDIMRSIENGGGKLLDYLGNSEGKRLMGSIYGMSNPQGGVELFSESDKKLLEEKAAKEAYQKSLSDRMGLGENVLGNREASLGKESDRAFREKELQQKLALEREKLGIEKEKVGVARQGMSQKGAAVAKKETDKLNKAKEGPRKIGNLLNNLEKNIAAGHQGKFSSLLNNRSSLTLTPEERQFEVDRKIIVDSITKELVGRASAQTIKLMLQAIPNLNESLPLRKAGLAELRKNLDAINKGIEGETTTNEENDEEDPLGVYQ